VTFIFGVGQGGIDPVSLNNEKSLGTRTQNVLPGNAKLYTDKIVINNPKLLPQAKVGFIECQTG